MKKNFLIALIIVIGLILLSLVISNILYQNKNDVTLKWNIAMANLTIQQNNINALQRVIQAFNEQEMSMLEQSVTPGFVRHDLAGAFLVRHTGSAEVTNFLRALFIAFPDIQLEVHDMIASEDRVTMRYQFSGTHKGELFGSTATGRHVKFNGINIYRFEDEKVAEVWQLWDWASVLHQIGLIEWSHTDTDTE